MRPLTLILLVTCTLLAHARAKIEIELDLTNQRAYLIQDGDIVYDSPISSGRSSHPTPTGMFQVVEKDIDHRSSLYGKVVDASGRVVKADADSDTPVPSGGKFVQAPMRHFLRFNGAIGMHAGILPGYPASHGCVRLPANRAALFFNIAEVGTPVRVYGKPPYRSSSPSEPRLEASREPERLARPVPMPPPVRRVPFFYRIF